MRQVIFVFFLSLPFLSIAQENSDKDDQKNHLFTFQLGYSNSLIGKTFGAKGCITSIGFNPAKFVTKTLIIGVTWDIKIIPGFGRFRASDNFLSDFNSNFSSPPGTGLDSANANVLRINLNSHAKDNYGIKGNSMNYLGIMFSLFPHKAGAILLNVKRGRVGYMAHQQIFENTSLPNINGYDNYPFTISKSWKYELTFKPLAFFQDVYIDVYNPEKGDFLKMLSISFFYEKVNFKTAEFNGTQFSTFLSPDFMSKYAFDNRFGFKIGISFY